jgi:hypothetical protein
VVFVAAMRKIAPFRGSAKSVLIAHNNLVLTVVFIMLGAVQFGKAVGSFQLGSSGKGKADE